jgi:hypothetical protein
MAQVRLDVADGDASYQFQVAHEDGWSIQVLLTSTSFSPGASEATVDDAVAFLGAAIDASANVTSYLGAKFAVGATTL